VYELQWDFSPASLLQDLGGTATPARLRSAEAFSPAAFPVPVRSGFRSRSCFRDPGNAGTPVESTGLPIPEPAPTDAASQPHLASLAPAAKVYLFAANVYLQDELRGAYTVELSPLNTVPHSVRILPLPAEGCQRD
jgi:hypothetical protein